jgi:hypothetical protein
MIMSTIWKFFNNFLHDLSTYHDSLTFSARIILYFCYKKLICIVSCVMLAYMYDSYCILAVLETKGILIVRNIALSFGCISSTWISKPFVSFFFGRVCGMHG